MSDGNTGIQVTPVPTESEMQGFRNLIDRALNAIVDASNLAKMVGELRANLDDLKHEIETVRKNNQWLDEQLVRVRGERDKANAEVKVLANCKDDALREVQALTSQAQHDEAEIDRLHTDLDATRKERDDYGLRQMEAEDRAKDAEAKLAKITETIKGLGLGIAEPKAEQAEVRPKAEPIEAWKPAPPPAPEPHTDPLPPEPKRIYEGEPGFNWNKNPQREYGSGRWYIEDDEIKF